MYKVQKILNKLSTNQKKDRYKILESLKVQQKKSIDELREIQFAKIIELLKYANEHVPYYTKIFKTNGVFKNNELLLKSISDFQRIPFLTKDIVRIQSKHLYSKEHNSRRSYFNTSGGSTGEPLKLLQDNNYYEHSQANYFLVLSWRGIDPFDSYIKLWGAERDIFNGKKSTISHLRDFVKNRVLLNSFLMSEDDKKYYVKIINQKRPRILIAYAQSANELAEYIIKNNLNINKINSIHTSAGILYDYMRVNIEKAFGGKVYNHYGSREVASIASECLASNGLHMLMEHNFVEIINDEGKSCKPGESGQVVITNLNNYSMPLIRYKIGDVATLSEENQCKCGCNYSKLLNIKGRVTDLFINSNGDKIDGEYFTHLFYFIKGVDKFQFIQEEINLIEVNILKNNNFSDEVLSGLEKKIKLVMGKDCIVNFKYVNEIKPSSTGKYQYTICNLK